MGPEVVSFVAVFKNGKKSLTKLGCFVKLLRPKAVGKVYRIKRSLVRFKGFLLNLPMSIGTPLGNIILEQK